MSTASESDTFDAHAPRRRFLLRGVLATASVAALGSPRGEALGTVPVRDAPLSEFGYGEVLLTSELHEAQLRNTHEVLMALSEDSLLMPFRQMADLAAPGAELGGWYAYRPHYDYRSHFDEGFAPGCHFGQWVSALARMYAITGDEATRDKVLRLNRLYAATISGDFYRRSRFPAYTYDKLILGLLDSHTLARDPQALAILERTTDTALPHLPVRAIEHDRRWRTDKDPEDRSWDWDESYTISENLLLAWLRGAGERYRELGLQFLDDAPWFDLLSRNENVLAGRHAYSYVNSLCSAMMAYLAVGSAKHLLAARNAFAMLEEQSYATGGWGPDESLRAPGGNDLFESLANTHHHFETPCGSYAHFKLTRYLLRATRDSRYGDSMERMMFNTVLGALPLQEDGRNFYYSDYSERARRVYKEARWTCCSGTLPQVAADYRINIYLQAPRAVFVNLYLPSTLRWQEDGVSLSLTQEGLYPFEGRVAFVLSSTHAVDLTLHFRIPAWAQGARILVNGEVKENPAMAGRFASIPRRWQDGDRVELELPLALRLEPIDPRHPHTVALLRGPLVLMGIRRDSMATLPKVSRESLLAATRVGEREWRVAAPGQPFTLLPFAWIGPRPYAMYFHVG
jgi:DUF1680 family protein